MGQLLWRYGNANELQSDRAGFRLIAGPGDTGTGYRYMILARDALSGSPLASGSRDTLREAIEAAEQAAEVISPSLPLAS